jgi:hypothetical protein
MMKKLLIWSLMGLLALAPVSARDLGTEAPQRSLGSQGNVGTGGELVVIPGLTGSTRVTYSVIIANDSTTDTLLVAFDVPDAGATYVPAPDPDIKVMQRSFPILPGEKLSMDIGAQVIALRALAGTIPARVIITRR